MNLFQNWAYFDKDTTKYKFSSFSFFLLQILPSANKCLQILRSTLFSLWNRTTWTTSEDEYPSPFAGSLHKSAVVPSRGGGVLTSGNLRRSLVIKQLFSTEHLFFSSDKCDPFYFYLCLYLYFLSQRLLVLQHFCVMTQQMETDIHLHWEFRCSYFTKTFEI